MQQTAPHSSTESPPSQPRPRAVLCPYCGHVQTNSERCDRCRGLFEPLSRQATQNAMGPWQVRSEKNPFRPGCSYEQICAMVERGAITATTIVRGPTTHQFWNFARNTPGVAVLLGECHNCHTSVKRDAYLCAKCGVVLAVQPDRQYLGLAPKQLLPGDAPPDVVASHNLRAHASRPAAPERPASTGPTSTARAGSAPSPVGAAESGSAPGPGTARRMRQRAQLFRNLVIMQLVVIVVLLIALAAAIILPNTGVLDGLSVRNPLGSGGDGSGSLPDVQRLPNPSPVIETQHDDQQSAPTSTVAPDASAELILDAGLEPWRDDIIAALALESQDTVSALDAAHASLQRILDEARANAEPGAKTTYPILQDMIDRIQRRIDDLMLREFL